MTSAFAAKLARYNASRDLPKPPRAVNAYGRVKLPKAAFERWIAGQRKAAAQKASAWREDPRR